MAEEPVFVAEETLDPHDWEGLRALAHQMVDDMFGYTQTLRQRAPWTHAPEQVKARLRAALPLEPQPPQQVYEEFLETVLPYPIGNIHPRFWGWVMGTGTMFGAMAEFLAGVMNTNTGGGDHQSANHVEKQVIDWIKDMTGYPPDASGVLTSGGSASNLIGLAVARTAKAGYDLRADGVGALGGRMMVYASAEIHVSVQRSLELLGLGSGALRAIPVDGEYRIRLDALADAIAADREAGLQPFCVVGAAGTTNTGAFDDLNALAELCQREGLWFHVDGAFGAWVVLAEEYAGLARGMERADSIALDLHKWMYMPFGVGCTLVRREEDHRAAFAYHASYLAHGGDDTPDGRGLTGGDIPWFSDYGYELSRDFAALKVWMSLKEHGARRYGRLVAQNIEQARYLAERVAAEQRLELLAPVPLSIVCFRYADPALGAEQNNALNARIAVELQEQGIAVVSTTQVGGVTCLRVANTNHRTTRADFDLLVQEVLRIGGQSAGQV